MTKQERIDRDLEIAKAAKHPEIRRTLKGQRHEFDRAMKYRLERDPGADLSDLARRSDAIDAFLATLEPKR